MWILTESCAAEKSKNCRDEDIVDSFFRVRPNSTRIGRLKKELVLLVNFELFCREMTVCDIY